MAGSPKRPSAPQGGGSAPRGDRPSRPGRPHGGGTSGRNHFGPEPEEDEPVDVGAAGRQLRFDAPASSAPRPLPPPTVPGPGGASPFVPYGPGSASMSRDADRARSQSMGVLAIVGGLVFMTAAALVATMLMLLAWFFLQDRLPGAIAEKDQGKDGHITDTGVAAPLPPQPVGGGTVRPRPSDDGEELPDFSAQKPGPATVIVPDAMLFFTIEVNCPSGYRSRGKFRKYGEGQLKATAPNVPPDERCVVTFQGSEPAKTYISGHQTLTCQFNPTVCDRVY